MPSLEMEGPWPLELDVIDFRVAKENSPGNYALYNEPDRILYVGRSDNDINERLKEHIKEYKYFRFSYALSPNAAFEKECNNYHDFIPLDNKVHPDRPDGSNLKCPRCNRLD